MPSRVPTITVQALEEGAIRYEGDTSREITKAEDDLGIDPFDISYPPGHVLRYGADPTGTADSSGAFQLATSTGHPVVIPEGTFQILSPVTYTGKTIWRGQGDKSILKSDVTVLLVTNGTGSRVDGMRLVNITAPWIIYRNPNDWYAPVTPVQSNGDGYQPTINDQDIWNSLTAEQQNQDLGPKITFVGNSSDITVSNITGEFVQITIYDAVYSVVKNINIRGGKGGAAAITWWNVNGQPGIGNRAENISVRFASFNSVAFARNTDGYALNVTSDQCGESGVKFWKETLLGSLDVRCYNMTVSNCKSNRCYYDGFDLCGDLPFENGLRTSHVLTSNEAYGCRGTGINIDGAGHLISGLKVWSCHNKGWWGLIADSLVSDITLIGNNLDDDDTFHEINEGGTGNVFANIRVVSISSLGHYAIYAANPNQWINVRATGRPLFFGNLGSISASLTNVSDDQTGADRLHNCEVADHIVGLDERGIHFWPRRSTALIPAAAVTGVLGDATSAHEYGQLYAYVGRDGALARAIKCLAEAGASGPVAHLSAPLAAPASSNQDNGTVTFWIDEAGGNLKFQVKYSNGTVKTGTLAIS